LTHERIELRRRGIVVVVDAAEPGEQRVGGAQLGQEFAASRPEALVKRRQHPSARCIFGQRLGCFRFGQRGHPHICLRHRHVRAAAGVMSYVADHDSIVQRIQRRLLEDHFSGHGVVLGNRQGVD